MKSLSPTTFFCGLYAALVIFFAASTGNITTLDRMFALITLLVPSPLTQKSVMTNENTDNEEIKEEQESQADDHLF